MKFENTKVMNFDGAFRGMRNPMNSWAKSDSDFNNDECINLESDNCTTCPYLMVLEMNAYRISV